jgi:gamma-glutamyltranspeptidase/glutathione hydrolase
MTMGPVMVFDQNGKLVLALGAAGGNRIAQAIAQVVFQFVDMGLSPQAAVDAPRVSYAEPGRDLTISADFSPGTLETLQKMGHKVRTGRSAAIHAIGINPATNALSGGADPGGEGRALGY